MKPAVPTLPVAVELRAVQLVLGLDLPPAATEATRAPRDVGQGRVTRLDAAATRLGYVLVLLAFAWFAGRSLV